jgi:diadenosine tetraphosphate (Ap4A) HIT family hydrolase
MVNLEPLKDGHFMVLPKRHVTQLQDLKAKESQAILKLLGRLEKIIPEIYSEDPIIFMNLGSYSTQPHLHFHILPSKGGLRDLFASYEKIPYRKQGTREELKKIADKVKRRLK